MILAMLLLLDVARAQVTVPQRQVYAKPQIFNDTIYYKPGASGSTGKVLTSSGNDGRVYWAPAGGGGTICSCDTINADTITAVITRGNTGQYDTMRVNVILLGDSLRGGTSTTYPVIRDTATGRVYTDTCQYWSKCETLPTPNIDSIIANTCYPIINTDSIYACSPLSIGVTNGGGKLEAMAIDTNGNVGIGTTTPTEKLELQSGGFLQEFWNGSIHYTFYNSSTADGFSYTIQDTTTLNTTSFSISDGLFNARIDSANTDRKIVFYTDYNNYTITSNALPAIAVDKNAYVGIGTVTPTAKLHVVGNNSDPAALFMDGNVGIGTATPDYKLTLVGNGAMIKSLSEGVFYQMSVDGATSTFQTQSFGVVDTLGNKTGISIDFNLNKIVIATPSDSMNVGIGTATPTAKLHVNGTTRLEGTPQTTTSDSLLTIDGEGNLAWKEFPYLVYSALISQTGTNNPTATILQNTLPGTPTWAYEGTGGYSISLTGVFDSTKTVVFFGSSNANNSNGVVILTNHNAMPDAIFFASYDLAGTLTNGLGTLVPVEIRVYK